MNYYNSMYNFCFQVEDGSVLYNSYSGACTLLQDADQIVFKNTLCTKKTYFKQDFFDRETLEKFITDGFLVAENVNELDLVRERFWQARTDTSIVLTITTTMDCNLGCYYCYESRTKHKLELQDINQIINNLTLLFENSKKKSLHIDWYGGEPLLNIDFLEAASIRIQEFCKQRNISYHSSIISNGTVWPNDLERFIQKHKIRQVQISFDGLKETHNKTRHYSREFKTSENNSFDVIVNLIDHLLNYVQVDIRYNIDWKSKDETLEFVNFIKEKGWFSKKFPAIFQPARIASYTEKAKFLDEKMLELNEFDLIRSAIRKRLDGFGKIEESEVPDDYPYPKKYVCAALSNDSFVLGADKLIYRCGLQVGEKGKAVGTLDDSLVNEFPDKNFWQDFDPTKLSSCSKCSFLPVCLGGCPKKHLDLDQKALDEQSLYWRNNLSDKVLSNTGYKSTKKVNLSETDQFREGY